MKPIATFLSELNARDISLWVDGERLRFSAPKGALGDSLYQELRTRKQEILEFLVKATRTATRTAAQPGAKPAETAIEPVPREGFLPLSFAQERMWLLHRLDPRSAAYNIPTGLRLTGKLGTRFLEEALTRIVGRHETLRTRFPEEGGRPLQVIDPAFPPALNYLDLSALPHSSRQRESGRIGAAVARTVFNLAEGPLFTAVLVRVEAREWLLFLCMHHIAADAWSVGILVEEVVGLYRSAVAGLPPALPELPFQYVDFAHRQHEFWQEDRAQKQLAYWERRLAEPVPKLRLPLDRPLGTEESARASYTSISLNRELTLDIKRIAQDRGATLFMALLAAFKILLHRYSEQDDLIVGTPIAGRGKPGTERLIGCLLNTLALRSDLSGNPTFGRLLASVRGTALEAFSNQEIPFEKLVEALKPERALHRHPYFDCMFNLINVPDRAVSLPNLELASVEIEDLDAKFPLALYVNEHQGELGCQLLYKASLFSRKRMTALLHQYRFLLRRIADDPERPIHAYSLVAPETARLLPDPASVLEEPEFQTIAQSFPAMAEACPDRIALQARGRFRTYAILARESAAVAQILLRRGLSPGQTAAVQGQPDLMTIAAMLGVFRAGGALLTLDPDLPLERRRIMVREASACFLVATDADADAEDRLGENLVRIDLAVKCGEPESWERNGVPLVKPDDAAYVFFTSGTTGLPKGVLGCHKGLAHFLHWQRQTFAVGAPDRCAQLTHLSFDVVLRDMFLPLTAGAGLCLPAPADARVPERLLPWIDRQHITLFHTVPSLAAAWLGSVPAEVGLRKVRTVFFAGEPLPAALVRAWRRRFSGKTELVNLYGPTETTLAKCFYRVPEPPLPGAQPVGRALPQTQALVLSRDGMLCGIGEPGEVAIRTPFRSLGYLGSHPDSGRFETHPQGNGPADVRYRTGDRGRYLPDGNLELLGRLDDQIKIRGIRIEPEEIASVLRQHRRIREAVVLAHEAKDGRDEKTLTAFAVPQGDAPPGSLAAVLRRHLADRLPEAMVPSGFRFLGAMPLRPNGKVDRAALLRDLADMDREKTERPTLFAAPRDEIESALAGIWEETLQRPGIGVHDDFFALGGHSLLATRVLARIGETFSLDLPLRRLFAAPTIAALAKLIAEARKEKQGLRPPPLEAKPHLWGEEDSRDFAMSFAQERLWFLSHIDEAAAYNMPFALQLDGPLHVANLERGLAEIVARHETLRTSFHQAEPRSVQRIHRTAVLAPVLVDLGPYASEALLHRLASAEAAIAFDLGRAPLLRVSLLRIGSEGPIATRHHLMITFHHLVADAWSVGVLVRELAALYGAGIDGSPATLEPLTLQYADFTRWQRDWLTGEVLSRQLDFRKMRLADAPPLLELPADRSRPAVQGFAGGCHRFTIDEATTRALKRLGAEARATPFMTLLTAYQILLARYSGQNDILVGTPVANRTRREIEPLIGVFVNTLVLRTRMNDAEPFRQLLDRVRNAALQAYDHQDLPFEHLVDALKPERNPSHHPIFQVMFELQNAGTAQIKTAGLRLSPVETEEVTAKFDLNLMMEEAEHGLAGKLEYSTELFDRGTAARMAGQYRILLAAIAEDPGRALGSLPLMTATDRTRILVDWNRTARQLPRGGVPARQEAQAAERPDATVFSCLSEGDTAIHLSYRALIERVDTMAQRLAAKGVAPETVVGLLAERDITFAVALLALLRSGGVYLPLDPFHPAERLAGILESSGAGLVLASPDHAAKLAAAAETLSPGKRPATADPVDLLREASHQGNRRVPAFRPDPASLAYLIFTSGSTGTPKGAMIAHGGMVNHLQTKIWDLSLGPRDVVAQNAPQSFDISIWQFLAAPMTGGRVHIVGEEPSRNPGKLWVQARQQGVTILEVVPSVLRALIGTEHEPPALSGLRWLVPTGEALAPELCRRWLTLFPRTPLLNAYGPTECSDDLTHEPVRQAPSSGVSSVSIGKALPNSRLYVLDRGFQPMPVGVPGELLAGGAGVGRGYAARPDLTAAVFVPDPFGYLAGGIPGSRLYKTGDRVRFLADSRLEFLGRLDFQVKIRGFRIELGEIDAALADHEGLAGAVVLARSREDRPNDPLLVAHLVRKSPGEEPSGPQLVRFLGQRLPAYMVPALFIFLDAMPVTPNGKVDRAALRRYPLPEAPSEPGAQGVAESPVMEILAGIWTEVLGGDRPTDHDDFFALGGHSLLATQVMSRISRNFGIDLPLRTAFEAPTLAAMSQKIAETRAARGAGATLPPLVPMREPLSGRADAEKPLPLSFAQQRLWFLDQLEGANATYNIATPMTIEGSLDTAALARGIDEVIRRHRVLRTAFPAVDGKPSQRIAPEPIARLGLVALDRVPEPDRTAAAHRLASAEASLPFHMNRGPMLRATLLRTGPERHFLLLTMHHIVSDGWSMGVMVREMAVLYRAFAAGEPSPLQPLSIQYADFADWQRSWLRGEALDRQLDFWREALAGAPSLLEMPTDRPRPAFQSFRGGKVFFLIDPDRTRAVRRFGRHSGVTLFMLLDAAFASLLCRYSGQQDVPVGTPVANRNLEALEQLIGFFVNTLILRHDFRGNPGFRELLGRVRQTALAAYDHQDIPFEQLVEVLQPERNMSHNPLFQAMFTFQNAPMGRVDLGRLTLAPFPEMAHTTAKFDLTMLLEESDQGIEGWLEYNTDLFDSVTARRMVHHYRNLLDGFLMAPDTEVSRVPMLAEWERFQAVTAWNDTARPGPWQHCVQDLIRAQKERVPDRVVWAFESPSGTERQVSYQALIERTGRGAEKLAALGIGPEDIVAVLGERSITFWSAVLTAIEAGAAYLPLDPRNPPERLAKVLAGCGAALVLVEQRFREVLDAAWSLVPQAVPPPILTVEDLFSRTPSQPRPPRRAKPHHLAYVLYTSGSTGTPKGAMVVHAGLLNHLFAKLRDLGAGEHDVIPQNGPQGFDVSVWQFLGAPTLGGRVEIFHDEIALDPRLLLNRTLSRGVTLLEVVPSQLGMLLAEIERLDDEAPRLERLRWMVPTGEVLPPEMCRQWLARYPGIPMMNTYGHTECSDDEGHYRFRMPPGPQTVRMPVGLPIHNTHFHLLDRRLAPVPIGVTGEVHIGGVAVGRGYLKRPERTAPAFIPDPFGRRPGARLYRTGDLAKRLHDGNLEFLTRFDFQLKIRGFRVEPGEIEAVLTGDPGVGSAAVIAEESGESHRLVAYVVPGGQDATAPDEDRDAAKAEQWAQVYDEVYRQDSFSARDAALNKRVWTNSYTGLPYADEEIFECVDDTVQRILALAPDRILEIGCGTGLLLSRLAPRISHYWGTDIAEAGLEVLRRQWSERESRQPEIELRCRAADDFREIPSGYFDAVVINEVVQYFPSVDYLVRVLKGAVRGVRPGGFVFVGGVRNLAMIRAFHAWVQLARVSGDMPLGQLNRLVRQHVERENELLVEPGFFNALKRRLPEVCEVGIQIKGGAFVNEFTKYRYDAVLCVGRSFDSVEKASPLNWSERGMTPERLHRVLTDERPERLHFVRVPNARNAGDAAILDRLRGAASETAAQAAEAAAEAGESAVNPSIFWAMGRDLAYDVHIRWSDTGPSGSYEVALQRKTPGRGWRPLLPEISASDTKPLGAYANHPAGQSSPEDLVTHLRQRCREQLPGHMVPAAFVVLDAMPLNANGKVDRARLVEIEPVFSESAADAAVGAGEAPRNPVEEMVAGIWSGLLGVQRLGIHDNFFAMGGHSLLATQVMSRVRDAFGLELPLRILFDGPTVADLASRIEEGRRGMQGALAPPLRSVPRNATLPLSFAQQRLWFLDQLTPNSGTYNLPSAMRLSGVLNIGAFDRAMAFLVRRHEALRTTFAAVEGQPHQVIRSGWPTAVPVIDLTGLAADERESNMETLLIEEAGLPFDLGQGPLFRQGLFRLSSDEHVLSLTMHHIISDDWSFEVMVRELVASYEAFSRGLKPSLPELPIQYADFAHWQRNWLKGEAMEGVLAYWRKKLEGAPFIQKLPHAAPKPERQAFRADHRGFSLEEKTSAAVAELCRQQGVTHFMVLLTAFKVLVHGHTGDEDLVVGTDVANRNRFELEGLIGFFINQLVLRTDFSGDPEFRELLARVRTTTLDAYTHQDMPFDQLVSALNPSREDGRSPLVQMKLVFHNVPTRSLEVPELQFRHIPAEPPTAKFDLLWDMWWTGTVFEASIELNTDRYDAESVAHLWRQFEAVLRRATEDPATRLSTFRADIVALDASAEEERLRQWQAARSGKFQNIRRKSRTLVAEGGRR